MANWRSRLIVSFVEAGQKKTISPIDSFQPSFSLNAEPIHSIEATHIGVIYSPDQINFSMTVKAVGADGPAARLTHLALQGIPFNVELEVREGDEDDWSFESIVLADCIITNATPSNASISGAPTATFSGFAMAGTTKSGATESKAGAYAVASTKIGVNV
ncbi:hypothetical protein QN222_18315 [Sinorhizobium sp. 6-70]|uniref:hypothetical protein n=2 Tax=unclassified Sinorhizobium TaxID=2613772 RepID=UPI0024C2E03C|nr:hypothetical protein [Sinorhizobium sp. 6-70]MDK1376441.1 hypothetical protein [Sinorhizobium sp. 6-70]